MQVGNQGGNVAVLGILESARVVLGWAGKNHLKVKVFTLFLNVDGLNGQFAFSLYTM